MRPHGSPIVLEQRRLEAINLLSIENQENYIFLNQMILAQVRQL